MSGKQLKVPGLSARGTPRSNEAPHQLHAEAATRLARTHRDRAQENARRLRQIASGMLKVG